MNSKTKIIGMPELIKKFKKLKQLAKPSVLENAVRAGLLPIQNRAVELAPYKEGNLKRSIHIEITDRRDDYVEGATGTDVDYAARQEFGFHDKDSLGREYNQPAHPYMRPAYDEKRNEAVDEVREALKTQLDLLV